VAERPLRLIIFTILYIFDTVLSAGVAFSVDVSVRLQIIPPQFKAWLLATYIVYTIVAMLILLGTLWVKSKMGYIIALIYITVSVAFNAYTINTPYALTFLILESTMLALLLSLWNYFTKP
jgi:uncharacterized membrane protein